MEDGDDAEFPDRARGRRRPRSASGEKTRTTNTNTTRTRTSATSRFPRVNPGPNPGPAVWTFIEGHLGEFSPRRSYGQSVARSGLKSVAQGYPGWPSPPDLP